MQGLLSEELLDKVPPHFRTIVSGPPGLCRAAYDALRALGRLHNTLFLDELPEGAA